MKPPRVSIHALMAAVIAFALDCMIVRSVSTRPAAFTGGLVSLLLASLPMAHVLAVGAALLCRESVRARPFLLGFEVAGILAVLATASDRDRILDGMERAAEFHDVEAWIGSLPEPVAMLTAYAIVAALFLLIQLVAALAGGFLARRLVARRDAGATTRPRLAPPLVAVLLLTAPALAIEGYLHWVVDPRELRRPAGSEAIVDLLVDARSAHPLGSEAVTEFEGSASYGSTVVPKGSPLAALAGARVRIDRDTEPCEMEWFAYSDGGRRVEHFTHLR